MADEWYDPGKLKGTGIYDFVEEFATRMTSPEARSSEDGEKFRRDAWSASLNKVTDERLGEILDRAGPIEFKSNLRGVVRDVLDDCGDAVHDLPHILIALSLSYIGINPRMVSKIIPEDWRA